MAAAMICAFISGFMFGMRFQAWRVRKALGTLLVAQQVVNTREGMNHER